ncbi:unnamed protein product [Dicrocoelium dendriticum]|nr:unnamed protein product [Dicrocoelium dendriticum]
MASRATKPKNEEHGVSDAHPSNCGQPPLELGLWQLSLRPPPVFDVDTNLCNWRRRVEMSLACVPEEHKSSVIMNSLSDRVQEILLSTDIRPDASVGEIWNQLEALFPDKEHWSATRSIFWKRFRREAESADAFLWDLRVLSTKAFPGKSVTEREAFILERFIEGINDDRTTERFIREPPRDLATAARLAREEEVIRDRRPKVDKLMAINCVPPTMDRTEPPHSLSSPTCRRYCHKCQNSPHEKSVRRPRNFRRREQSPGVRFIDGESELPCVPLVSSKFCESPTVVVVINAQRLHALIDTGAACSLLKSCFLSPTVVTSPGRQIRVANGMVLRTHGVASVDLLVGQELLSHEFYIADQIPWDAILGVDFLSRYACVIDLTSGVLTLRGKLLPLNFKPNNNHVKKFCTLGASTVDVEGEISELLSSVSPTVDGEARKRLENLLRSHKHAFAWKGTSLGRTSVLKHRIETGDAPPIRQGPRRVPPLYRQELQKVVDQMLKDNIIRPSRSPWAAPIVLVKKKDGTLRICVDYRKLNDVTRKDSFPLPRIDDTLESLHGATWFSTLDLASGYWQVEVHPMDIEKTAFVIPTGLYEFQTMPFGLANAPATFQRLMHIVLRDLQPSKCLVYLDDVIVHGRTLDEHLTNLETVLQCLSSAGLKLKPSKCDLLKREVKYLGHVISDCGIRSDPSKVQDIISWPIPESVEEVRSFLGLASYYRRFVKNYADMAAPLHRLTEKGRPFHWSPQCQESFDELRHALASTPILVFPDVSPQAAPFILDTDASDVGIGAVLSQVSGDGMERVIAYASRKLTKPERNYCTTRKEMLALVSFVKHFRHFLLGRHFIVRTDHQALRWLREFREPEGQVARWQEQLQAFDFECQHRPGKQHRNADALSRRPSRAHGDCPSCSTSNVAVVSLNHSDSTDWASAHSTDPETKLIYERLRQGSVKPTKAEMAGSSWEAHCLWSLWSKIRLLDGVMYYQFGPNYPSRLIVPQSMVQRILEQLHRELGHAGQRKMEQAAGLRFWWPQQRRDIANFCNACHECIRFKQPQTMNRAPLQPMVIGYPNETVGVDVLGPLPETPRGNRYILVLVDYFTKWCEAIPTPYIDARSTAQLVFDHWISRWGAPEQLHSDRGSNFESLVVSELCRILDIRKTRTTAYHPQSNGQVERTNRSLKALLKAFTEEHRSRDWDIALPRCLLSYRSSVHSSTDNTPHFMVTGREMRLPIDLTVPTAAADSLLATDYAVRLRRDLTKAYSLAREHLGAARRCQKDYYDRKVHGCPLQPGQQVYLHTPNPSQGVPAKLHKEWSGPFVVEEVYTDSTCRIYRQGEDTDRSIVVHFNRLKPATLSTHPISSSQRPVTDTDPPDALTEVEVTTTEPHVSITS